jgi:hypothetical protein
VNESIEEYADSKTIRFLDSNDKLAGKHGNLFDGMMVVRRYQTAISSLCVK